MKTALHNQVQPSTTKYNQVIRLLLLFTFFIHFSNTTFALERILVKDVSYGAEEMRQYTMVRTNGNDGFIFAGATPYSTTTGKFVYHVFRKHDNGTIIWNYYFYHDLNTDHQITHVDKNVDANGYVFSGYTNFLNSNAMETKPVLFELDENGAMQQEYHPQIQGGYFKIKPTPKGDYIVVGYRAPDYEINTGDRFALVIKLDATFTPIWQWFNQSFTASSISGNNHRWDMYQAVDVFLDGSGNEQYYVGGSVTDIDTSQHKFIRNPENYRPIIQFSLLGENGNVICERIMNQIPQLGQSYGRARDGWITDMKVDTESNLVWVTYYSKDLGVTASQFTPGLAFIFSIELGSCFNVSNHYGFEGKSTTRPGGHIFSPFNIQISNNHVWVFANYTEDFQDLGMSGFLCSTPQYNNYTFIPLLIKIEKNNFPNNYVAYTYFNNTKNYCEYPMQFDNGVNGTVLNFGLRNAGSPYFTQDIGHLFYDSEENIHYAMLGYENAPSNTTWSLEFISDIDNIFCNAIENDIDFLPENILIINHSSLHWLQENLGNPFTYTLNHTPSSFLSVTDCEGNSPLFPLSSTLESNLSASKIYPNPTDGILYFTISTESSNLKYEIASVEGKIVQSGTLPPNNPQLNLSFFPNGFYTIKLLLNDQINTFKFIIQK
jgi:hypothetical protein